MSGHSKWHNIQGKKKVLLIKKEAKYFPN